MASRNGSEPSTEGQIPFDNIDEIAPLVTTPEPHPKHTPARSRAQTQRPVGEAGEPSRNRAEGVYTGSERLRRIAVKELARKLFWAVNSTFETTDKAEGRRRRLWAEEAADALVDDQLMYDA